MKHSLENQLHKQLHELHMTHEEKNVIRERLTLFAREQTLVSEKNPIPSPYFRFGNLARKPLAIGLALVLLLVSVSQPASASALPGQVLYPVKLMHEEITASTKTTPEEIADYEITRTERRIDEARQLAENNNLNEEIQAEIAARIQEHSDNAKAEIIEIIEEDPETALALNTQLETTIRVETEELKQAVEQAVAQEQEEKKDIIDDNEDEVNTENSANTEEVNDEIVDENSHQLDGEIEDNEDQDNEVVDSEAIPNENSEVNEDEVQETTSETQENIDVNLGIEETTEETQIIENDTQDDLEEDTNNPLSEEESDIQTQDNIQEEIVDPIEPQEGLINEIGEETFLEGSLVPEILDPLDGFNTINEIDIFIEDSIINLDDSEDSIEVLDVPQTPEGSNVIDSIENQQEGEIELNTQNQELEEMSDIILVEETEAGSHLLIASLESDLQEVEAITQEVQLSLNEQEENLELMEQEVLDLNTN